MHPELPAIHNSTIRVIKPRGSSLHLAVLTFTALFLQACTSTEKPSLVRVESRTISVEKNSEQRVQQTDNGDRSTPLEQRKYNIERAEYYKDIAEQESSDGDESVADPVGAILSAAEFFIQADNFDEARRTLQDIADRELSPVQQDRYDVVAAYIDYSRRQHADALNRLAALLARHNSDDEQVSTQVVDALLLSSFSYQALQQFEPAIDSLIQREQLLHGQARAETSRYIWQVINALSAEQKQTILLGSANAVVRNRIDQSSLAQIGGQAQTPAQFDQWRAAGRGDLEQIVDSQWNETSARNIAVILPLSSKFNKAAQALMDGLKYQHSLNDSPVLPSLRFYDAGDNPYQTTQLYSTAISNGADFVIGPLGKDYANQLSSYALQQGEVPTLLLGGDNAIGRNVIRLTMSPERDGIRVAKRALAEGHVTAAILVPDSADGQRIADSFVQHWLAHGGRISNVTPYSGQQFDHSTELKQLFTIHQSEYRHQKLSEALELKPKFSAYRRSDIDFIFMIANNKTGRIVRPQINFFSNSELPVYGSASVYNGIDDRTNNIDLDQTQFPVMPWIIRSVEVSPYAGQLNMLFAMGADAYKVAGNYRRLRQNPSLAIEGDMGRLSIGQDGEIRFQMLWAKFIDGAAKPANPINDIEESARRGLEDFRMIIPQQSNSNKNGVNYDDSTWDPRQSRRKSGS